MDVGGQGRLAQVALRAQDLDRAIEFYRDILGLPFVAKFDPPGLAFFDLGGTRLLLEGGAPSSLLYWRVADIDAAFADLKAKGVAPVDDPHLIFRDDAGQFGPPGTEVWMASFKDSEDNLVVLNEDRPPH
jgi:methylmalonyl-CoA/ethylmalonyl-CoA epimerase